MITNKIKFVTMIIVLFSISLFAQEKVTTESGKTVLLKEFDFRKTKWGNSVEKVKSSEAPTILLGDGNTLITRGSVAGLECTIGYCFVNGKLWRGVYAFSETHSNKNMFITDYNSIKDILIEKYGEPEGLAMIDSALKRFPENSNLKYLEGGMVWLNDLYADDKSQYGLAVSIGHLTYYCEWEIGDTKIHMVLSGDNYNINHILVYYSKSLEKLSDKEQKKVNESNF